MDYKVVAYLPGYATDSKWHYNIAKTRDHDLTHLIYCFGRNPNKAKLTEIDFPESDVRTINIPKLLQLKESNKNLKTVINAVVC